MYSFDNPQAPERHETQYFEMMGNRGIYHKGWTAVTKHRTPWEMAPGSKMPAFDSDLWELYDTNKDWSQSRNLAKEMPDKLREMQRLWLIEAAKYNVLPLDDRITERTLPEVAGRPRLIRGKRQLLFGGMGRLTENSVLNVKNVSHSVTAEVVAPESGAQGVIVAQGGSTGGWCLYAKDGRPRYCYNFFGLNEFVVAGAANIPPGKHQVRMEFRYDGGGLGKGGQVTLYLDGQKTGEGRVEQTQPAIFSADETCDVGDEFGSPVTKDYPAPKKFNGEVNWVEIDVDKAAEDLDHMISPDERLQLALARQ
jgi:arylsulfatase